MGIFSSPSLFDSDVDQVTDEKNTGEDWGAILDICDKVKAVSTGPKDCLKAIMRRLSNSDPHIALQAVTLIDACVKNCGRDFHLEVASRDFENEFRKLVNKGHPKVSEKLRALLKKWAANEFSTDTQLALVPSLYKNLKAEGFEFGTEPEQTKKVVKISKNASVVAAEQEEEDLAKAIELSLKEQKSPTTKLYVSGPAASSSLYPSASSLLSSAQSSGPAVKRQVRALYDFEAAEDNELTFVAGDIVNVIDDSDPNWWKGTSQRGEGLFPANFVTNDLTGESEESSSTQLVAEKKEELRQTPEELQTVEIDEEKIDRLLGLLHDADPEGERQDPPELATLEVHVNKMAPLIDAELDRIDRKHFALTKLNSELVEAMNMYHGLMRESPSQGPYMQYRKTMPAHGPPPYYSGQPDQQSLPHPGMMYGTHPSSHHPGLSGASMPPGHTPEVIPGPPQLYGIPAPGHHEMPPQYHPHHGMPVHLHHQGPPIQAPWMQQPFQQTQ